jgi:hypothetical protein
MEPLVLIVNVALGPASWRLGADARSEQSPYVAISGRNVNGRKQRCKPSTRGGP